MIEPSIRRYTIDVCDDCMALNGEMCNQPGCVFCWVDMDEVSDTLYLLMLATIDADGQRHIVQRGRAYRQGESQ